MKKIITCCAVGLLALSACRFPPPTRPESGSSSNSSKDSFTEESAKSPSRKEVSNSSKPEDLLKQIQELRADHQSSMEDWDQKVRALQDKVDILQHDFDNEKKKNEKITQDMDQRLIEIEKKGVVAPAAPTTGTISNTPSSPTVSNDVSAIVPEKSVASTSEQKYQTILDSFLEEKNYDKSIKEFKKFIQDNPKDSLAGNAQYWIGEGYYSKADYPKAITEFQKVPDQYPNSSKKCDALLKQGMAFSNMKDSSNAKLFLHETGEQCPKTAAADKAKKLLKDLK